MNNHSCFLGDNLGLTPDTLLEQGFLSPFYKTEDDKELSMRKALSVAFNSFLERALNEHFILFTCCGPLDSALGFKYMCSSKRRQRKNKTSCTKHL